MKANKTILLIIFTIILVPLEIYLLFKGVLVNSNQEAFIYILAFMSLLFNMAISIFTREVTKQDKSIQYEGLISLCLVISTILGCMMIPFSSLPIATKYFVALEGIFVTGIISSIFVIAFEKINKVGIKYGR